MERKHPSQWLFLKTELIEILQPEDRDMLEREPAFLGAIVRSFHDSERNVAGILAYMQFVDRNGLVCSVDYEPGWTQGYKATINFYT